MTGSIRTFMDNDRLVFLALAGISAGALAAAFIGEYVFGLKPCILCLYQRWPFAAVILLCIVGTALAKPRGALSKGLFATIALAFFGNAAIAFYHTGVERHWWRSHLEGCVVPPMEGNITDVLAQIAASPPVRCDEIPWTDPVLGLSMANYNVALCLALGLAAAYALFRRRA
jgi:disulfide bond formation protein DsbB